MEVIQLAQLIMDLQQAGPGAGMAGRERRSAMSDDGFTQLFLQLMYHPEEAGNDSDLMELLTRPEEEEPAGRKSLQWEMLMAMLDIAPRELDFRQFTLQDPGAGITPAPERIQETTLPIDDVRRLFLTAEGFRERFTAGAFDEENILLLATDLDAHRQALPPAAEAARYTVEAEAGEAASAINITRETETTGAAVKPEGASGVSGEKGFVPVEDAENKSVLVKIIGYRTPEEDRTDEEELRPGQEQFRQAVQEAKHRLADKENKADMSPKEALPVNTLIAQMAGIPAAEAQPVETPGIPDQILLRLSGNLSAGKGEFVMKLIPEGLGEITVKLLAKEGRTTLRIITASAETARLINQDIQALQDALKPIRVEVREAVPQAGSGGEADAYFTGFNGFSQFNQFTQYQNQDEAAKNTGGGRITGAAEEAEAIQAELVKGILRSDAELDRYI